MRTPFHGKCASDRGEREQARPTPPELARFQQLLRELFQFDCADLDFGTYRIMNHKREVVDRYIDRELMDSLHPDRI